jgi:Domain of unknown function (DUF1840).
LSVKNCLRARRVDDLHDRGFQAAGAGYCSCLRQRRQWIAPTQAQGKPSMLVKFNSSTSGQIMMLSPVARQLLEILQKDCTARGVITTEQLPEAIACLRRAVADGRASPAEAVAAQTTTPARSDDSNDDQKVDGPPIGLAPRAFPLIELLEWTRKEDGFVLWEAAKDF